MPKKRSWSEITEMAIKASDAMLDYCEQLASLDNSKSRGNSQPVRSVYDLMKELLEAMQDSPTKQAIACQWHEFGMTQSQHDSIPLIVETGVGFAKWLRNEFAPDKSLKLIRESRRSASNKEALPTKPAVRTGNHERDQWLYDRKKDGLPMKSILAQLDEIRKSKNWEQLRSIAAIDAAIKRHITRHPQLQQLAPRKSASTKR